MEKLRKNNLGQWSIEEVSLNKVDDTEYEPVPGTKLRLKYHGNLGNNGGHTYTAHDETGKEVGMIHDVGTGDMGGAMNASHRDDKHWKAVSDAVEKMHYKRNLN